MTLFVTFFRRLGQSWRWILVQLILTPVLLAAALAWTRIPEKNFLEVAATFLIPFLLIVSFLELEAGTMRAFATNDGHRVKLVYGAIGLVVVGIVLWLGWGLVDTFDAKVDAWSSYLNSQSPAHTRIFTYERYSRALTVMAWILRWVLVPGLLLPFAAAVAQSGKRLPWRKLLRSLTDWKWWPGVAVAAVLAIYLPSRFFDTPPHGTVHAQEWHIGVKLGGAFLLKLVSWILLLAWQGVLFDRIPETVRSREAELYCKNLRASWRWIAWAVAIILLINLPVWPLTGVDESGIASKIAMGIRIAACAVIFVLMILFYRSMFSEQSKKAKIYWGILASIAWFGITFAVASQDDKFPFPLLHWKWGDFITFVGFAPFVASAAVWGWLLPWKRIGLLFKNPQWLAAGVLTFFAETCVASPVADQVAGLVQHNSPPSGVHDFVAMSLSLGFVALQLAWLAALLDDSQLPPEPKTVGVLSILPGPSGEPQPSTEEPLP